MSKRTGLLRLDAFAKTVEDAKVRTSSGGAITIVCLVTLLSLIWSEWNTYNEVVHRPELVVDRDRQLKLDLNLDITFPKLPCDMLSLDIMDVSGEYQLGIQNYGFTKTRIVDGKELDAGEELKIGEDETGVVVAVGEDYCGPCYGSRDQTHNGEEGVEKVCCNDCESVRTAYASQGWAFYDGKDVEQCEREGYVSKINSRMREGCRVRGTAKLNRINGNVHFAPGASSTSDKRGHLHDLSLFLKHDHFRLQHTINHFSFGPDVAHPKSEDSLDHLSNHPLDGLKSIEAGRDHLFSYYLKVVPTRYEYLNGTKIETNQFSSTYHDRPLVGGRDQDHPNTFHARGGIPGVFFHFEMSPLKIINREKYSQEFSAFVLNVISAVGGVLTVGALVDRGIIAADKIIRRKKDI